MFSSAGQSTPLRPLIFSSLVLLSCFGLFFTYYKADIELPTFGIGSDRHSCPEVVCAEATQTQNLQPNCSTEQPINPEHNDIQEIQAAAVDTEPDTIILIWMWPFGVKHDVSCSEYNIRKCHVTDDRSLYHKAHGVLFHHRDIQGAVASLPQEPRPWFQKWVWFNMESNRHSAQIAEFNDLFNLTCSYKLDSSIPVPYGSLVPLPSEDESFKLPAKDKLVCWIVSNWNPQFDRVVFYNEFKNHVTIHTYGRAFGPQLSGSGYVDIVPSCKFYLSFENSIHKDYLSEKVFRPLVLGSVPVVLGPPRQNYEEQIPADSFIHVNDFSTPKELADRLLYLDKNDTEYMSYHSWRKRFKAKEFYFGRDHACKTCQYLQNNNRYQSFRDLNKWYWG